MNALHPGARVQLQVDRLSLGGDGVGRFGAGVVFIPYSCPGDTLEVEITEAHRTYARAKILQVVAASPQRIEPPCPYHFHVSTERHDEQRVTSHDPTETPVARNALRRSGLYCGGCSWQQLQYTAQLEAKRQLVRETLERIGGLRGVNVRPTLGMKEPWRYRNKVQQPVGWDGYRLISGFYAPFSHHLVPIDDCLVQSELSVRLINRTRALLQQYRLMPYDEQRRRGWIRHLWVRTSREGRALLVFVTRTEDFPHATEIIPALIREFPPLVGIHQNINPGKTNVILGRFWKICAGDNYLEERLGRMRFRLSPGSFFQINTQQTEVLYDTIKSLAGRGQGLLDLYGGAGGIALWLASQFEQVVGVDEMPSAVADAEQNARLNRITNTCFVTESADRFISHFRHPNPSRELTVILDPPRAGCHPRVLQALSRIRPYRVIYVSCDPGTLSRDLKYLNHAGFSIHSIQPVDLFPHTPHIETVVEMTLRR